MMVLDKGVIMTTEQQVKMIIGDLVLQVSNQAMLIEALQTRIKELSPPQAPENTPEVRPDGG